MNNDLKQLLAELEHFGQQNDLNATHRDEKMLNITHDTGVFLAHLVHAMGATRILEIGTSNGYSTLWLAHATAQLDGHVTTIEQDVAKIEQAKINFNRAHLTDHIMQVEADAGQLLLNVQASAFDIIFLDSDRSAYLDWWPHIRQAIRVGGAVVVDNATSHAQEMQTFMEMVTADACFSNKLVDIGNGEFMAIRTA